MTTRRSNANRKLAFQTLESRQLMAGDVAGAVKDHSLTLSGDNKDNSMLIVQVGQHDYKVTGLNGTKIDGHTSKTYHDVKANLTIQLGDGNDSVQIGEGANGAATGAKELDLLGDLTVNLGNGNNTFALYGTVLNGAATVNAGKGNDTVIINSDNIGYSNVAFDDDFNMSLGGGNNRISLSDFDILGSLRINNLDSASDNIAINEGGASNNMLINTGAGADRVQLDSINVGKQLNISTGAGADKVILSGSDTSDSQGPHHSAFVQADQIFVELGSGNDILQLGGNSASNNAGKVKANQFNYDGGSGSNTLFYFLPSGSPVVNHKLAPGYNNFTYIDFILPPSPTSGPMKNK